MDDATFASIMLETRKTADKTLPTSQMKQKVPQHARILIYPLFNDHGEDQSFARLTNVNIKYDALPCNDLRILINLNDNATYAISASFQFESNRNGMSTETKNIIVQM